MLEEKNLPKWINFAKKLIRISEIDYFNFKDEELIIECHFHIGQSYEVLEENYANYSDFIMNSIQIQKILGIIIA